MVTKNRNEMIEDNIGLVHSIAKRFKGRGEEYDDLYQAGCVGLIKAVDNFDESKGFLFSTYAVPVIMGEIRRLFRDGGAVKVSRSLKEKSIKVQAIREKFIKKELREPTVSELSELCGIETEELSEVLNVIKNLKDEGSTMIVVTHEMEFAKNVSDKIMFMADGVVEEIGTPQQIYENPHSEKTKTFLANSLEKF